MTRDRGNLARWVTSIVLCLIFYHLYKDSRETILSFPGGQAIIALLVLFILLALLLFPLSFAKTLACCTVSSLQQNPRPRSDVTPCHVQHVPPLVRSTRPHLSTPSESHFGKLGAPAATRCAETSASAAKAKFARFSTKTARILDWGKGIPNGRSRAIASGRVLSHERLGGLHHRYNRAV